MYAHSNSNNIPLFSNSFTDFTEFDSFQDTLSPLNNSDLSSGYSSYGGSPSPSTPTLMQRSISSHSFHHNNGTLRHPLSAFFAELLDSEDAPVRKVCSTGDLQRIKRMQHNHHYHVDSPLSSESSMIIEGMNRVCPYSPEEKKLRIERYKRKRNQRNFNKKIKYVCRKTLADRRPRIRGRFARNDEIDKNMRSHIGGGEEEDEEDGNWINIFDSIVAANLVHDEFQGSSSFGLLY
ncbi:zinc finger protein CONSTANS-LIKE 2 [Vicia villosa]|uniref:zinc finger protein CONSTANS-LIKE 2 n=1 Tax=Vicia villosa TaxID=3911 RepID=UPI00273BD326|nr:zinc finger protein CONSTANS-LIKE 2 [Vicia villosa]